MRYALRPYFQPFFRPAHPVGLLLSSAFPVLRLPSRSRGLAAVLHPVLVWPFAPGSWLVLLSPVGFVRRHSPFADTVCTNVRHA